TPARTAFRKSATALINADLVQRARLRSSDLLSTAFALVSDAVADVALESVTQAQRTYANKQEFAQVYFYQLSKAAELVSELVRIAYARNVRLLPEAMRGQVRALAPELDREILAMAGNGGFNPSKDALVPYVNAHYEEYARKRARTLRNSAGGG